VKRIANLWPGLACFQNLLAAADTAAAGKRSRPDVALFFLSLEPNLLALCRELENNSYCPGAYRTFQILDPKPRQISAAPFRDRVVHHALTRILEPVWERRFLPDSFACRKGFGTHLAIERARAAARDHPYVLKCDIRKYFASLDHEILNLQLARVIKCRRTLALAATIIAGSNPQEPVDWYFPGDDLFTPFERRRGLPLGNQTSQFFANVYLDPLDHFIRRQLKPGQYARYVDDFVLFGRSQAELAGMRQAIEEFLIAYRLRIHPLKSRVYPIADGFTFLGWRIFPTHTRLVKPNVKRFRARLRQLQHDYRHGRVDWDEVNHAVQSWIGHASHGNTWRLRERIFDDFPFVLARAVSGEGEGEG